MITPLDIQNKEFGKSVNGYKKDEVDEFLDLLTVDFEKLVTENTKLKSENKSLELDLEKYKGAENAVVETLEAAKALMGDISASAEKRAELLLKNATLDAELITREARESIERLTEESMLLRNRFVSFQAKYRSLLEIELEKFDTLSSEIFAEFDREEQMQLDEVKKKEQSETPQVSGVKKDDFFETMVNLRTGDGA
jgi:cell division initiation protein